MCITPLLLSHAQKDVSLCSSRFEIIKFANKTNACISYQTKYYIIRAGKKKVNIIFVTCTKSILGKIYDKSRECLRIICNNSNGFVHNNDIFN